MKRYCKAPLLVFFFLSFIAVPALAEEAKPSKKLTRIVDEVRKVVGEHQGDIKDENLDKQLKDIIGPAFDFREMSRRSLGRNWDKATEEEQKEFVDLFSDLLARNYLEKINEGATTSTITVVDEAIRGKRAVVRTRVEKDGENFSIDYRLRYNESVWQVYDVIVENIGLVTTYNDEFADIVRKHQMSGLITRLRDKKIDSKS